MAAGIMKSNLEKSRLAQAETNVSAAAAAVAVALSALNAAYRAAADQETAERLYDRISALEAAREALETAAGR